MQPPAMAVLNVAYPFAPVGPDPVGGAEQIVAALDARLVRDGLASVVLAACGSRALGQLVTIPPHAGWIDDAARTRTRGVYRETIARICRDHPIELIHVHGHDCVPDLDVPVVATLHLPRPFYGSAVLASPCAARVCVSQAQRRTFAPDVAIDDVIENGVAVERYRPSARKDRFVLALGRICPEKGFELALRAARDARLPLVLAGHAFPYREHHRYATEIVAPLLDTERQWIGPIGGERKRRMLADARCLVITSLVDETSSLVAMEALASGTPVVALARGALPEIVDHGRTGLLVDDPAGLPDALVAAAALSPSECRRVARERFSAARMTASYLELYRRYAHARPRRTRGLEISIASNDRELAELAGDWDTLCDRCPTATPFQRPAWLLAHRRWLATGGELRAAIVRRGGRLVALVPLELRAGALRLVGEGVTDYLDAIAEPDLDPAVLRDAVLRAAGDDARTIELAGLRPCSALRELGLGGVFEPAEPSPVMALDAVRVPRRAAYEARRLARRTPSWSTERDEPVALIDGLVRLHGARWAARGEPGVLADPAVAAFHRDAALALHRGGMLRLTGVAFDGALQAVLYGVCDHGRFLFYLSGFDPRVTRLSLGRLVIARAIERAADDGAFEFDFLRGREPYKYEWGAIDRPAATYRARLRDAGA